jgi:hypothetical protein
MNRMLIAGTAFAAALGAAGLALAQPNPDNYEHGGKPSWEQQAPSPFTSPGTNSPLWGYGYTPAPPPYYPPAPPYYGR